VRFIVQADFDADGITSGTVWERYLKRIAPVTVRIPSGTQGHISTERLIREKQQNPASHLVVLDNGTNSWPELIPHLRNEKVLVVDHYPSGRSSGTPTGKITCAG
jgi:single-stranded DNA-specific DHH superfamily exonuclease